MAFSQLLSKFEKRSSESAALFHHFPGAIYEFRDRIWRVTQLQGSTPVEIYSSDAFQKLLVALKQQGISIQSCTTPQQGASQVFPQTWFCSNPGCNRLVLGDLRGRDCTKCKSEMRQLPIVVICDRCGHLDTLTSAPCRRCRSAANLRLLMYERHNIGSWKVACQTCLEAVLRRERLLSDRPSTFRRFQDEFGVWSDLEPGAKCRICDAGQSTGLDNPGKRVAPAGSNVVTPAFTTTFDQDIDAMTKTSKTCASNEMSVSEEWQTLLKQIRKTFAIKEVYLTDIMALSCTYGFRVGRYPKILPFPGNSVYLRAEHANALLLTFDHARIAQDLTGQVLHSAAHALVQVAGYVSGLGNEVYREYVDEQNHAVLIFTTEAGGCDLFLGEKEKLVELLRRARTVVNECKNQCKEGCPWCLHIRTHQCSRLNRELNRSALASLWSERFLLGTEPNEYD